MRSQRQGFWVYAYRTEIRIMNVRRTTIADRTTDRLVAFGIRSCESGSISWRKR